MNILSNYKPAKLYSESYIPGDYDSRLLPVVFVHGICSLHSTWSNVWKRIANDTKRQVFSLDIRNHGVSEWNDCFTLEALVTDLESFLIENGIKKCILVSHSLGGRICMYLTLIKPEFVDRIVVEDVPLRNPSPEETYPLAVLLSSFRRVNLLSKGMTERQVRCLLSKLASESFPEKSISIMAFYLPLRKDDDGGFEFDFNLAALEKSFQDGSAYNIDFRRCHKFSGPSLFLFAEKFRSKVGEDSSIPEYFLNAEFQEFKFAGHVLHLVRPNEYVEKVSKFINS